MPTTTEAFRGGVSVTGLTAGDTSLTIQAGTVSKTIPVHVWANLFKTPTLPQTVNGVTFTKSGDGIHAKGTSTAWATIRATVTLTAGEYTLEHTTGGTVDLFAEVKNDAGTVDLFSNASSKLKGTLPAGDYTCIVSIGPSKTVDADITPVLRKLS